MNKNEIKDLDSEIEDVSLKALQKFGVDIDMLKNYVFGKAMAFNICFGASVATAKFNAINAVSTIKYSKIYNNKQLISKLVSDKNRYNFYDELVSAVYSGDLEKARELCVPNYLKSLSADIVKDIEALKKLVKSRSLGVSCRCDGLKTDQGDEVALDFIDLLSKDVSMINLELK